MAYLNGKEILFSPKIHIDPTTEEKLQAARQEGKLEEWGEFWDTFQQNGTRTLYENAFNGKGWDDNNFKPKYDIICSGDYGCSGTFRQSLITDLKGILEKQKVEFDTRAATKFTNTFAPSTITRIPTLHLDSCTTISNAFSGGTITELEIHNLQENCTFTNPFNGASKLSSLILENCTIGQNNFNLKSCSKLSKASITSVINALSENREHLETIGNPVVTLSKTAVQNAFTIKDDVLSLPYSNYGTGLDGITVTDNGDGSLTVNGTTNTGGGFYYLKQQSEFELPKGTYKVELDGDTTNSIIFALECDDSSFQNNGTWAYTNGENARAFLVFEPGANYNNVTIRPKILCDEWDSLTHIKNLYWTISLV